MRLAYLLAALACLCTSTYAVYDCIVVGDGLSGLTAAYRIARFNKTVLLVGALSVNGGRTRSAIYQGNRVSIGGTWSMFENRATLQLASEVHAQPFVPVLLPKQLYVNNIVQYPYLLLQLWYVGWQISDDQGQQAYWRQPGAAALDTISVEDWMDLQIANATYPTAWVTGSKQAVRDWFWLWENINATNPASLAGISALVGSQYLYQRIRGLSQEGLYTLGVYRWDNGTGVFVDALVQSIKQFGGTILVNAPVTSINYTGQPVVKLANGTSYTGKYVIVATSLTAAATIAYTPALPYGYLELYRAIQASDAGAVNMVCTWSDRWYYVAGGNAILPRPLSQPTGVFGETFEVGPSASTDGVLRILAVDPVRSYDLVANPVNSAIQWLSDVYNPLGLPLFTSQINQLRMDVWDWRTQKPYIPGIVYYFPPNGSMTAWGDALRTSVSGKVFWAGSERAHHGQNWMEGAIQQGNTAACEVLHALGAISNCTEYDSWLNYAGASAQAALQNATQQQYQAAIQNIQNTVCSVLLQSGWPCRPDAPFRLDGLNAFEIPVWSNVQHALSLIALLDATIQQLGAAVASLFT